MNAVRDFFPILHSHQHELLQTVKYQGGGSQIIVVAPAGSGKTTAAISILNDFYTSDNDTKAVFIVQNRTIAEQLALRLTSYGLPASVVTKRSLRLNDSDTSGLRAMRPVAVEIVAASSLRDPWFRQALSLTPWDLVIHDSEDLPESSIDLMESFALQGRTRLLILTSSEPDGLGYSWTVIHWRPDMRFMSGEAQERSIQVHLIPFTRSESEESLISYTEDVARLALNINSAIEWYDIAASAHSSPYALQASCLRNMKNLHMIRNMWAHGRVGPGEADRSDLQPHSLDGQLATLLTMELEKLVDHVDRSERDGRLDALRALLRNRPPFGEYEPTVIFTGESRTRDYLLQNLTSEAATVGDAMEQYSNGGGRRDEIIIAHDPSLQGARLEARRGIAYDSTSDGPLQSLRLSQLGMAKHNARVDYWILADISRVGRDETGAVTSLMKWLRGPGRLWLAPTLVSIQN